jgi:transcriptional regulator with XRE-family HTH domain
MDGRRVDRDAARLLGKNLWRARRRAGYSQEELGALASVHRTHIGYMEIGQRLPRVDTLLKVASVLGVRLDELVDGIVWVLPAPTRPGSFLVEASGLRGGADAR